MSADKVRLAPAECDVGRRLSSTRGKGFGFVGSNIAVLASPSSRDGDFCPAMWEERGADVDGTASSRRGWPDASCMGRSSLRLVPTSVRCVGEKEPPRPKDARFNGEGEQMGVLGGPRLRGLSTTPSSTSPFEKSMAADAASVAERNMYGLDRGAVSQLPPSDSDLADIDFSDPERRLLVNLGLFGGLAN